MSMSFESVPWTISMEWPLGFGITFSLYICISKYFPSFILIKGTETHDFYALNACFMKHTKHYWHTPTYLISRPWQKSLTYMHLISYTIQRGARILLFQISLNDTKVTKTLRLLHLFHNIVYFERRDGVLISCGNFQILDYNSGVYVIVCGNKQIFPTITSAGLEVKRNHELWNSIYLLTIC